MERREFMTASLAGGLLASTATTADDSPKQRQLYEVRAYTVHEAKVPRFDAYLENAYIPRLNRMGVASVGAYVDVPVQGASKAPDKQPTKTYYVIAAYESPAQWGASAVGLADDAEYQKAAADFLSAPASDPIYKRIASSLLHAIEGLPQFVKPAKKAIVYNLRIYESHNEAAGTKKIEMFNKGELDIFRRVGLTPVLFGKALAGASMPNLTYLLAFDDEMARVNAWNRFRVDPEWLKLKAIPEYEDKKIVSKITNILFTPTSYSQI